MVGMTNCHPVPLYTDQFWSTLEIFLLVLSNNSHFVHCLYNWNVKELSFFETHNSCLYLFTETCGMSAYIITCYIPDGVKFGRKLMNIYTV
jgi:hypothetical protein